MSRQLTKKHSTRKNNGSTKQSTNQSAKQSSKQSVKQFGELRIIAGRWRSRKLTFPAIAGLRPSPSRVRETLFSWLTPMLTNSHCLDLFAGSGALGFEALSRGANAVTMVEQNKHICHQLLKNKDILNAKQLSILNQDGCNLSLIEGHFDIVFCDPPFNQGFIQPLIDGLEQSDLLNSSAMLYLETEKSLLNIDLPDKWTLLKEKVTGDVRYRLIEVGER